MDRFERHGFYARAWGTGLVAHDAPRAAWVAEAIGARGCRAESAMMTVVELDAELRRVGVIDEPADDDDDCDVGPSARDQRIAAEAHARLSKLILAGGHVETGGRSLYEAAEDEIVRLRAALSDETAAAGDFAARVVDAEALVKSHREARERFEAVAAAAHAVLRPRDGETLADAARRTISELQQAKEALAQARAKADTLRGALDAANRTLDRCDDSAERRRVEIDALKDAARRGSEEAREHAAAEMRERAAGLADAAAELADAVRSDIEARRYRALAARIRTLPLSGAPVDPGGQVVHNRTAGQWWEPFSGPDGKGRVLRPVALQSNWDAEHGGLSAEDVETLRRGGRVEVDAAIVRKAPAPARGTPGKATGAEAAEAGSGSVAEEAPRAQGARGGPEFRAVVDGAGVRMEAITPDGAKASWHIERAPAALPKPQRVEVGQRWSVDWRDLTGEVTEYAVEAVNDDTARLIGGSKGVSYRPTAEMLTSLRWTFLGPAPQDPPKRDGEAEPDEARRAEVNDFAKGVISEAKRRGLISNDIMHELAGIIDRRLWPELHPITGGAYAAGWQQTEPPVFVPGPVEVHGDPTPRGAYVVGEVTRGEQAETTEPTARDAVAGMLLRCGWSSLAEGFAEAKWSADEVAHGLRASNVQDAAACIAALEALARGDIQVERSAGPRAGSTIRRVARERDESRAEAAALREELRRREGDLRDMAEEVKRWCARHLAMEQERDAARKRSEGAPGTETVFDVYKGVRLTFPRKAESRAVAAACVELLGLSSDEVHGGNVVEAFDAGVAEGERRAKAKAEELTEKWTRRVDRHEEQADADAARGYGAGEHRYRGRAAAVDVCVHDIRKAFGIEPNEPTTGEPAPEASEVVAPPATTAIAGPPGAPDRETLGRAVLAVLHEWTPTYTTTWEQQSENGREHDRRVGERLFNMGVQWAQQNAAAPSIQRLHPITPGPVAKLVERIAGYIADVYSDSADGELRSMGVAIRVLQMVDEYLQGAVVPEAQDERWQPGAVWEYGSPFNPMRTHVLHIDERSRAHLDGLSTPVPCATMTPDAGWCYVGPAKAATPDDGAYKLPALGSLTGLVGAWENRARALRTEAHHAPEPDDREPRGRAKGLAEAAANLTRMLQGKPPFEPSKAG